MSAPIQLSTFALPKRASYDHPAVWIATGVLLGLIIGGVL